MLKIAILGDIGSGKSYISKQFGYPVFNADDEVAKIYKKNKNCFYKLKKKIPHYISSFPIKKKNISKAIIDDEDNLKKIIKIVHPIVRIKMKKFFKKNKKKKIVILDVPLLIENKLNRNNYILIFVDSKKKEIIKRLKKRPNFNKKVFNKLRKTQLPLEVKKRKSNYVIKNNFKKIYIKKTIRMLKNRILENIK